MKEKIIEILYMESYSDENRSTLISEDFEEVANKIISLFKSEILTNNEIKELNNNSNFPKL